MVPSKYFKNDGYSTQNFNIFHLNCGGGNMWLDCLRFMITLKTNRNEALKTESIDRKRHEVKEL